MNSEGLLAHYGKIADAPDAIARLRRFILDLAVRGRLVPQDPTDEPASELLKRIAKEKARLANVGEIGKLTPSSPIQEVEQPVKVPTTWAWARLCDIGALSGGMTPSMNRPDYWGGDIVWLSPKDIKADEVFTSELKISSLGLAETRLKLYPPGCLFMVARSGILKRTFPVAINRVPAASNQDLKVLTPFLQGQERFLQLMFRGMTDYLLRELVKTGTTVQSLKYAEFENQPFPLPPLAEQHRIVAKVDELMALCDRLEAARTAREEARNRLSAATLARLSAPDPETFKSDTRFALDALPVLTARPDQIKALRQTILNLAVRGKLVSQNANDEPASELLERIVKEKTRLVKAGEIKRTEAVAELTAVFHQFPVPSGWSITNVQSVFNSVTDGDHLPPPKAEAGIPFLVIGNVRSQKIEFEGSRFVPESYYDALDPIRRPRKGDLLYTLVGSYGIPVIVRDDQPFCVQRHIGILRPCALIDVNFLARVMESRFVFDQATNCATGIAQKTVPLSGLRRLLLPLPPIAEQRRIVVRVESLMALCDRLEVSIDLAAGTRRRLLDALLTEALAPVNVTEMEAAE